MKALRILIFTFCFSITKIALGGNDYVFTREVSADARTTYDIQSNGSSFMMEQNPVNPDIIHAIFIVSTNPGPGYDNRNVRYFYSSNGGSEWHYIAPVAQTRTFMHAGLQLTNDDRAVVQTNCTDIDSIASHHMFVDLAPGVGSWYVLNPPGHYISGSSSSDLSNNKILFTSSEFVSVCTNLNSPGIFLNYTAISDSSNMPAASAVGLDKYGIAFITINGSVRLIESTNQGASWGAAQTIWNWRASDSTGAFRGIDIRYNGSTPQVVFELCHIDPVMGSFNPKKPAKIAYWSPTVNNGNVVIVDSAGGVSGSNSTNDLFVSVCRPVIGKINSFGYSAIVFCKARQDTSNIGNNFYDIYVSCSGNNGEVWSTPQRLTNLAGQFPGNALQDCRYPSVSDNSGSLLNIIFQADTIPGSNVNGASPSLAKMYFIKGGQKGYQICIPIGITPNSNEIPASFILKQNYPNPFNPVTQVEFGLPERAFVTLTIYNTLGESVAVLLNGNYAAGSYKADWNASAYPSGVYFYELKAGNFTETKKMVLIK